MSNTSEDSDHSGEGPSRTDALMEQAYSLADDSGYVEDRPTFLELTQQAATLGSATAAACAFQTIELLDGSNTDWNRYVSLIEQSGNGRWSKRFLARCYACGYGVPQDFVMARKIWVEAYHEGSNCSAFDATMLDLSRAETTAQVEELQKRLEKLGIQGCSCASAHATLLNSAQKACPDGSLGPFIGHSGFAQTIRKYGELAPRYRELLQACAKADNVEWSAIISSVQRVFPQYHQLNANGIPIPGKFDPLCIPKGLKSVSAVEIDRSRRQLTLCGSPADIGDLSLVFPEDWDVAQLLVFGPHPYSGEPGFGLEEDSRHGFYWPFLLKSIKPAWLEHTAFGSALYYADYLMKQIVHGGLVSLIDPSIGSCWEELNNETPIPLWLRRFGYIFPGKAPENDGSRQCLQLKQIDVHKQILRSGFLGLHQREIIHVVGSHMYIDSSYCKNRADGTQDSAIAYNDTTTPRGAEAAAFTAHYDDIANLFPVFARIREVFTLVKVLQLIRDDGFILPKATISGLLTKLSPKFPQRPEIIPRVRITRRFEGGSDVIGGASMEGAKVSHVASDYHPGSILSGFSALGGAQEPTMRYDFSKWDRSDPRNLEELAKGNRPFGSDGERVHFHHVGQGEYAHIDVYSATQHREQSKLLHDNRDYSSVDRSSFSSWSRTICKEWSRKLTGSSE